MIFKVLPARKITWSRVMLGAFVTSLLFNVGKVLIGLYLSQTAAGSSFGAAGSLMVLLIWIYYSTQILTARRGVHEGLLAALRRHAGPGAGGGGVAIRVSGGRVSGSAELVMAPRGRFCRTRHPTPDTRCRAGTRCAYR